MPELPSLRGERVLLRPGEEEDADALLSILQEPEVARWWPGYDDDRVLHELIGGGLGFVIEVDGVVAGWLGFDEEPAPDYRSVGLDLFLATAHHGRGYGREVLRLVIRHFIDRGHHRFTIDPAVANERAIRAYAGVGFKPVGVMRQYERGPDGGWHDSVLMDLLASEVAG